MDRGTPRNADIFLSLVDEKEEYEVQSGSSAVDAPTC